MNKFNKNLQKAIAASSALIGSVFLFGVIGFWLQSKYNNDFWLIMCLVLGATFGLYELYKQINR